MLKRVRGVKVVYWNPRRRNFRGMPIAPRVSNFGDLLGPWIVRRLVEQEGLQRGAAPGARLLTVGTILARATQGATLWGTGARQLEPMPNYVFDGLDVRATRGPLTARALARLGIESPGVFGDPGLLLRRLAPELNSIEKVRDIAFVPNYADADTWARELNGQFIDPRGNMMAKIREIVSCRAVVASSLHALIVADAFDIPSVRVASRTETDFKYQDYALGAGRENFPFVPRLADAEHNLKSPQLEFDSASLIAAFPRDLWRQR